MAQCKDCIHNGVCRYHDKLAKIDEYNWFSYNELDNVQDFCKHFIADVVPKSEVAEEIFAEAIKLAKEIADNSAVIAELEENPIKRIEAKGEQIGALMVWEHLAELKKKYTEGEHDE